MSFQDEMEQFDEQWEEDKTRSGVLGDGSYQAAITEARIEQDDNGRFSWMLRFQAKEGSIRKWSNLDHEVGRSIAAQDAKRLGYEGKLSGLEEACESEFFLNLVCEIAVKTKPGSGDRDYTNVYINRVLGKGNAEEYEPAEAGATTGSGSDDDIPF